MKRKALAGIIILVLLGGSSLLSGQNPPAPNWGYDPGNGNSPVGGGASLGGGLVTLLALAAGYGSRRLYDGRKRLMD